MINIKPEWKTSIDDAFNIFNSKNLPDRNILDALAEHLEYCMMCYVIRRKKLHLLEKKTYETVEKEALERCYDSNTQALSSLKKSIINNIKVRNSYLLQKCPYCLVRQPGTWDHYMPKSKYPEFSVFSANLIWVCDKCNNKKSNGLVEGVKETIQTYFDILPNEDLLKCEIRVVHDNIPVTEFYILNPNNSDIINSLINHFNAFELAGLYKSESSSYISVLLQEMANNYLNGISEEIFIDEMRKKYKLIPLLWGNYNWEAAVLKGMSECSDLVDVINRLPKNTSNDWQRK